jgi:hypothetical protein
MKSPAVPINPAPARVPAPPISQAARWAAAYDGRAGPLINLSQAVPGNAPPPELADRLAVAAGSAEAARYGAVLGDELEGLPVGRRGGQAADQHLGELASGDGAVGRAAGPPAVALQEHQVQLVGVVVVEPAGSQDRVRPATGADKPF